MEVGESALEAEDVEVEVGKLILLLVLCSWRGGITPGIPCDELRLAKTCCALGRVIEGMADDLRCI